MELDEPDPILIQVTVPLPTSLIFSAFTDPAHLTGWLCDAAEVEPKVGGTYRLVWREEPPFESNTSITHFTPDLDIGFDWKGPAAFDEILNLETPPTSVYVRLQDSPEGIDVTLEHRGWKSGDDWAEARTWHFHFWDDRLHRLKTYLLKVAYG